MAKKPTPEEKLLADASKLIMHTLHVVSVRLADRYEKKLMTDLIAQMQARLDANEEVSHFTANYINDKLNDLSK